MEIQKQRRLRGEITIPGDKSVSHRAVMFGSLAEGTTRITNFLQGADCLSTIHCFRQMGIGIRQHGQEILVDGRGLHGLCAPSGVLDAGNSGTTTRLMSGILAGQVFESVVDGDASLRTRPMKRIRIPLEEMGAALTSLEKPDCLPLRIRGGHLRGISYHSPVASAQVKSCVLLAGLYADGPVSVTEPVLSRDHTERMLRRFGADVRSEGTRASVRPGPALMAQDITVPGDISSAAYFIAAGLLSPESEILIRNVGINPTRDGILRVCRQMGADVRMLNVRDEGEPAADLLVRSSSLHGTVVEGEIIPALIDEIPMIAVMAAFAKGTTVIRDAAELKVKESDRIRTVTDALQAMGARVTPTQDGMIIEGGAPLHGGEIDSCLDHRIAMAFAVAGTVCDGPLCIRNAECVDISYPGFFSDLYALSE